jgi:hypothetical protein
VEADLLDGIGEVGAGERQILEGSGEATEMSRISNRRPELSGDLGLCVHWRRNRLAFHHASSLNNIESKLTLSEEEPVCLILYEDSQKMMDGAKILHGEFLLEGRGGEDNVINIKHKYTIYMPHRKMNKEVSDLALTKHKEVMYVPNRLYQA